MENYWRFSSMVLFYYPLCYLAVLAGGMWPYIAIAAMTTSQVVLDNLVPLDKSDYRVARPKLLDGWLYLHLPCGLAMVFLIMWQAAPGDLFGTGAALSQIMGPWVGAAHAEQTTATLIANALVGGFILSSNTIAGHELVHRLQSPADVVVGRWLLALNGDAQFSISHVFGHHANVGTLDDPATARRGESLYAFVVRSAVGQYREAVALERARLEKKGQAFFSWSNKLFSGVAMTAGVYSGCFALAGWPGVGALLICNAYAKFLFETVNYIQHYGLVRIAGERVHPRHSWDCAYWACSNAFYALSRHSHHHARPGLPYWRLEATDMDLHGLHLRHGYLANMLIAMIPPLWFRFTSPVLLHWDQRYATRAEAGLARQANQRSGIALLAATDH